MRKTFKRITVGLLSLLTAASAVACGGGGISEIEYDFTETDKKISYTFYAPNWQAYEGADEDRVIKFLEDKFNVDLNITGASGSAWLSRLTTEIADNNAPDVFFSLPDSSTYTDYVKKQVVVELNPFIEKAGASNLQQILATEQYKDSTLIDGKNYFLPQSVGYTTRLMMVRKDWMAKWNMASTENGGRALGEDQKFSEPKTLSELTSMLTYFREKDPDGDGKKNTYGMGLCNNFDFVQDFFATFGLSPEYYTDENGKLALSVNNPNYDKMTEWFKNGSESGYIQTSFFSMTEEESVTNFTQGKTGMLVISGDSLLDGLINALEEYYEVKDPTVSYKDLVTLIAPPDSDDGKYKGAFKGWNFFWGGWSISSTAEEPMRLIRIFDYLVSPEGQKLMVYGLEGIHYTEENGVITPNNEERLKEGNAPYAFLSSKNIVNIRDGRYTLGTQWMPCPYKVENNKLVINYPYDTSRDPELMKLSYDLTVKNTPNFNALRTIISNPNINNYNSRIIDAVDIYTINVIAGKDKSSERDALNKKLNSANLNQVLEYINK